MRNLYAGSSKPFVVGLSPLEIHLLSEYLAIWLCDEEDRGEINSLIAYFDELITHCIIGGEWREIEKYYNDVGLFVKE